MSCPTPYFIVSSFSGSPKVGIGPVDSSKKDETVKVLLSAKVLDWTASHSLVQGGPVKLSINSYPYTAEFQGDVVASTNPDHSQDWYIIPADDHGDQVRIATDKEATHVWTAEYLGGPIRTEPLALDRPQQLFRFTPRLLNLK